MQQYARLREWRLHLRNLRNACLQELIDSYRAARASALRRGRDRPIAEDWIRVRAEEIRDFMVWQERAEPDLRRRHAQAEQRRIERLRDLMTAGRNVDPLDRNVRPWQLRTEKDFGRPISKLDQKRRLADIRAADPEGIGHIPLEILRDQVDIVHRAMDGFFRRLKAGEKPGFPRYKSYERVRSLGCTLGEGIQLKKGRLFAPMLWHGGLEITMHRDLPGKPRTVRLTYDGRFWHVTIACEVDVAQVAHAKPGSACGVDAGVNRLLTYDDGSFAENPRFGDAAAPEIRRLARRLARAKWASLSRHKARRALAAANRRLRNRRSTHRHKVALDLARRAETVYIEDLKLRNMTASASGTVEEPGTQVAQKRGLNRGILDAAIATIYTMARYKAASAGGRIIAVDPRHTSQDCSECGGREPGARRQERYRCSCGAALHADHNAARNILARGLLAA
ncbi:RNA-guided endonuclease InsQ/TnpB family protein [Novosphingobium terrae]|uniref:RNA-guided endonuclease InsQ/TnpB family protein n=1 Tax=Novosphingobium terrae TaxID=2726189 RepID=UPI001981DA1E|nr:RNA-guided endonuclease TnpB family protein [Novosphingobium terrae]